eukprot:snap_masked-scaffold_4-processed-gene-0.29-mRNA-1 protein AED:1.00 eAED:1.00 QI:0/0/0/0/1/1/2/0/244
MPKKPTKYEIAKRYYCRNFSENFLNFFNILLIVLGIIIVAVAFYGPFAASLSFGIFLFLSGILGYYAVKWDSKCLQIIYILGLLAIATALLVLGVIFLVYSDRLDDEETEDSIERAIQDAQLAAFVECCNGVVVRCVGNLNRFCVSDQDRFEDFKDAIGDGTCEFLEDIEVDGDPLVGRVADGGCGLGVSAVFVTRFDQYLEDNLTALGGFLTFAGILIFLLLLAACNILWTRQREKQRRKRRC